MAEPLVPVRRAVARGPQQTRAASSFLLPLGLPRTAASPENRENSPAIPILPPNPPIVNHSPPFPHHVVPPLTSPTAPTPPDVRSPTATLPPRSRATHGGARECVRGRAADGRRRQGGHGAGGPESAGGRCLEEQRRRARHGSVRTVCQHTWKRAAVSGPALADADQLRTVDQHLSRPDAVEADGGRPFRRDQPAVMHGPRTEHRLQPRAEPDHRGAHVGDEVRGCADGTITSNHTTAPGTNRTAPPPLRRRMTSTPAPDTRRDRPPTRPGSIRAPAPARSPRATRSAGAPDRHRPVMQRRGRSPRSHELEIGHRRLSTRAAGTDATCRGCRSRQRPPMPLPAALGTGVPDACRPRRGCDHAW